MSDVKNILVLAGDGVGPEVCKEAIKVINSVTERYKFPISIEEELIGGASIDLNGVPLSDEVVKKSKLSDAIVLGAVGGPKWDHLSPQDRPEKGLLRMRSDLDLFANLRPCIAFSETANASSLKADVIKNLDLLIVRELTGGIYFGQPRNKSDEEAFNTMIYSRKEIVRIAEVAFESSMRRNKKLCSVDKANVLEVSELWREVVEDVSKNYPEVELSHMLVDNAAMQLVKNPKQFDVIVSSNLFGDILSDIGSMLTGSIGMLPSASLDIKSKGLYEPVHGTAPDIAGKGIVNPIATILSVAMMYKYTFNKSDIYLEIENAVKQVLANGYATPDIANEDSKILTTEEMGSLISDYV
jgi:3-isopropylmalate dehydrogenase|tara:strand:+ start:495 stop:1559 length:1065 start_codon:yes stop_codon:yes gene_type:complete